MSETIIAALIGAGATLVVTVVTQITYAFVERTKNEIEMRQKAYETKRNNLNDVYKELITIINMYPNSSPNDSLKYVDYPPNYSMEHFDAILKSLDYQIEDYKKQLVKSADYQCKGDIETQISNREYSKKEICSIRDEYYNAKERYNDFCNSGKVLFDLYAGQDVRNCLVEFDVVIHNVFISGYKAGENEDQINNIIRVTKRKLINSMRRDIGIH